MESYFWESYRSVLSYRSGLLLRIGLLCSYRLLKTALNKNAYLPVVYNVFLCIFH